MAVLTWDDTAKRLYETGVEKGVLFVQNDDGTYGNGVAWNGLTSVTESPDGAEANDQYADDIKYVSIRSAETFGGTIEAFTFPPEWNECDGSAEIVEGVTIGQQTRKAFGLAYKTMVGNDVQGNDYGYKLHLVYNATASPSEKQYETVNDSPEAITMSWEFATNLVSVKDHKPTATIVIDSTKTSKDVMKKVEDMIYGTATQESTLPSPDELIALVTGTTTSPGTEA